MALRRSTSRVIKTWPKSSARPSAASITSRSATATCILRHGSRHSWLPVGGGTQLPTQRDCPTLVGCTGGQHRTQVWGHRRRDPRRWRAGDLRGDHRRPFHRSTSPAFSSGRWTASGVPGEDTECRVTDARRFARAKSHGGPASNARSWTFGGCRSGRVSPCAGAKGPIRFPRWAGWSWMWVPTPHRHPQRRSAVVLPSGRCGRGRAGLNR